MGSRPSDTTLHASCCIPSSYGTYVVYSLTPLTYHRRARHQNPSDPLGLDASGYQRLGLAFVVLWTAPLALSHFVAALTPTIWSVARDPFSLPWKSGTGSVPYQPVYSRTAWGLGSALVDQWRYHQQPRCFETRFG